MDKKKLILKSLVNGKTVSIKENAKVKVDLKDDFFERASGRLVILNDSTIRVGLVETPITSIRSISTKDDLAKKVGAGVIGLGIIGVSIGTIIYVNSTKPSPIPGVDALDPVTQTAAKSIIVLSSGIVGLGAIVSTSKKRYNTDKYEISIILDK